MCPGALCLEGPSFHLPGFPHHFSRLPGPVVQQDVCARVRGNTRVHAFLGKCLRLSPCPFSPPFPNPTEHTSTQPFHTHLLSFTHSQTHKYIRILSYALILICVATTTTSHFHAVHSHPQTQNTHTHKHLYTHARSYIHHALNNTHVLTFLSIAYKHKHYHRHFPPHLSLSLSQLLPPPHTHTPFHKHTCSADSPASGLSPASVGLTLSDVVGHGKRLRPPSLPHAYGPCMPPPLVQEQQGLQTTYPLCTAAYQS